MKRFFVKPNFGHFKVVDDKTNKMVVGYSSKKDAEATADGLNKIKTESGLQKRIKSLQTLKGYGYYAMKKK